MDLLKLLRVVCFGSRSALDYMKFFYLNFFEVGPSINDKRPEMLEDRYDLDIYVEVVEWGF